MRLRLGRIGFYAIIPFMDVNLVDEFAQRTRRAHLHYIAHLANVPSILRYGILSHDLASQVEHEDISMHLIQDIREGVIVDQRRSRQLHEYANLYWDARNPMMYKRRTLMNSLAVLHVAYDVLNLVDTVVSDGNAAGGYTRFYRPQDALTRLPFQDIFAERWTDPDEAVYFAKKSRKCAEVLVWQSIHPAFIIGASVCCQESVDILFGYGFPHPVYIDKHLFFC